MTIEKLEGTSPRLYTLVAPLVMRRSVLRQNNYYPFWTSSRHVWFVATEGAAVSGFVPVEATESGTAKVNNYFVSGDDGRVLTQLLQEVVRTFRRSGSIQCVVHVRHAEIFRAGGFVPVREWKQYVKMEYGGADRS